MRNAGLEEAQAGIKIARRNINNLRYAESEEELKSLLMKVKVESEKVGLKLNTQKTKIMASSPTTSWEIDGETVSDLILGGSKITADGDCSHEIKRLLGRKVMTNLESKYPKLLVICCFFSWSQQYCKHIVKSSILNVLFCNSKLKKNSSPLPSFLL